MSNNASIYNTVTSEPVYHFYVQDKKSFTINNCSQIVIISIQIFNILSLCVYIFITLFNKMYFYRHEQILDVQQHARIFILRRTSLLQVRFLDGNSSSTSQDVQQVSSIGPLEWLMLNVS